METKSVFSNIHHIGVVVKDLDRAIKYYESLGIGPFEPRDTSKLTEKEMYGKPTDFKLKIAVAQLGPVKLELTQPDGNAPVQENFLKTRGEGINHLAFAVDNVLEARDKLVKKGLEVILSTKTGTGRAAYFDTKVGGVIFEVVQW